MGGSTLSNVGRGLAGAVTLGGSELLHGNNAFGGGPLGRGLSAGVTGGLSEFAQKNPFGVPINNPFGVLGGNGNTNNPYVAGPFSLDPNQLTADQQNITDLGNKQYQDTLGAIDTNQKSQQDYAGQTINRMLPGIYEDMNSRGLLNSNATGQEIGRQTSYAAQDLASQAANARMAALSGKQGFDTSALQRGLSLEDFTNQANVAKTIGAQMAPQVNNGKGTTVSGLGAGAAAGAPFGPWGSAVGGGLGALLGSSRNGK